MDEFKFVMKCLVLACLIFSLSQYRQDGVTIESRVHGYLVGSSVAEFVNESARGAVKMFNKLRAEGPGFLNKKEKVSSVPKNKQIDTEDIDLE